MEFMKTIAMRKSTRSYKPEQISGEQLNTIINAGCAAPVGLGAYETMHLTIIQNRGLLDKITKSSAKVFGNSNDPLYGAPTFIVISGKPNNSFPNIELADAACIIENMALAAADMGLGSAYLFGVISVLNKDKELLKELNLPDGFEPVSGIAIGYSAEPITKGKELKQTIKTNRII